MRSLFTLIVALGVVASARPDDTLTLAYRGDVKPVRLRLHLRVEGRPVVAAWEEFVGRVFARADRNGNGSMDEAEARLVPSVAFLRRQVSGSAVGIGSKGNAPPFVDLDADRDGKVSPTELRAYYRREGFSPLQMRLVVPATSRAADDILFRHLDRDGDGTLSKAELDAAPESLHRLDVNEDEMIAADEVLLPSVQGGTMNVAVVAEGASKEDPFVLVDSGPAGLGLSASLGQPQPKKSAGGLLASVVSAARPALRTAFVDVIPAATPWPLAPGTRRDAEGTIHLATGQLRIDLRGGESGRFRVDETKATYTQEFRRLLKGTDTLTQAAAADSVPLASVFALVDRDGDGRLTAAEVTEFCDLLHQAAGCFATLTVFDTGRSLFDLLDADRDSRLGPRELRAAWSRAVAWDVAGAKGVTRAQIPRQFHLVLSHGPVDTTTRTETPRPSAPPPAPRGPVWFRKMDRNGDGDVSAREWLGPIEEFRRLDTDGDGLLSVEEAERASRR